MKRMHVGIRVRDLAESRDFYTRLFGCPPTLERDDYAKWMLDDPYINLSIIARPGPAGLHHIGIQLEDEAALDEAREQLDAAGLERADQDHLTCGYQVQSKSWVYDPQGVAIEQFFTYGVAETFGSMTEDDPARVRLRDRAAGD